MDFNSQEIINIIERALKEDICSGDLTAEAVIPDNPHSGGQIIAKSDGILCGIDLVKAIFQHFDERLEIVKNGSDGAKIKNGDVVLTLTGPSHGILACERVALNFLGKLSGIATMTGKMVVALGDENINILDTRKTTPGLRILEKYAVICGGGKNHRNGLYDAILIKENHIAAAGGIEQALETCMKSIGDKRSTLLVEVEVRNLDELKKALHFPVNRVMLDNFSLDGITEAISIINGKIEIEISGGVTLETIRRYRGLAIDYISSGAITHSAPGIDFSLLI